MVFMADEFTHLTMTTTAITMTMMRKMTAKMTPMRRALEEAALGSTAALLAVRHTPVRSS